MWRHEKKSKALRRRGVGRAVVHGRLLVPIYRAQVSGDRNGLLFGGRHFDLDALIWIASAVGLFFILRNIWSLYVKIKRSLFPQGDMVAAQKASGH